MKIKRILGKFPVFGSNARNTYTTNNKKIYSNDEYTSYTSDEVSFSRGFQLVEPTNLTSILNILSKGISYLYQQGIPEFTNNYTYPKDSVVTFDGNIYIALQDTREYPTSKNTWTKVITEDTLECLLKASRENYNSDPIGTIKMVPKNAEISGYIDYIEEKEFSKDIYSDLFMVLGTNVFPRISSGTDDFPIGTLIHSLNITPATGWVLWNKHTNLSMYPDLKSYLYRISSYIQERDIREAWITCLASNKLPVFEDAGFYLRAASEAANIASYSTDSTYIPSFGLTPVVVDTSHTLNPKGISNQTEEIDADLLTGINLEISKQDSPVVITAHPSDVYSPYIDNRIRNVELGTKGAKETAPKSLQTNLFIKACKSQSDIPPTHKRVIKAF